MENSISSESYKRLVTQEILLVMRQYDEKIEAMVELGLISRYDVPEKSEYVKVVARKYRDSFKTNERKIYRDVVDECMEMALIEREKSLNEDLES